MKILVVDDNKFIQELTKSMLEPEGYEAVLCSDAEEAIAALEQGGYSLVITDMVMPGKSGAELMEHIKRKKIPVPILAITGGVENAADDYVGYADLFSDHTLAKPVKRDEFLATVKRLIASRSR